MQYHGWARARVQLVQLEQLSFVELRSRRQMLQQTVKLGMRAMPSKEGIVQSEGLVLGPAVLGDSFTA